MCALLVRGSALPTTILEERIISGRGVLKVPVSNDTKKAKILTLFADVIRTPKSPYVNYKYNPPKSVYAQLAFMRGDYVQSMQTLEFTRQLWEFQPEGYLQSVYAIACTEAALRVMIAALGVPGTSSGVSEWRHNQLWFDSIKIVCHAETAVRLVLKATPYDVCVDLVGTPPSPPPPPPPPVEPLPPTTPLGEDNFPVSPPYDPPSDGDDTQPLPGDEYPDPPVGCWEISATFTGGFPPSTDYTIGLSTDIPALRLLPGATSYELYDAGTGRTMRTDWIGVPYSSTITAATFHEVCPVENPYGIPPT